MFMEKSELSNTIALTKLKLNANKKTTIGLTVIVILLFLLNLIPALIYIFQVADTVVYRIMQDYSILFSVGVIIAIIILTTTYRQTNGYYSVYPQTNNSRFISSQIIIYFLFACAAIISLIFYLIQYGIFKIISILNENIILAYKFDLGFVIKGFFVLLIYGFIIISIISLIGVLIRKFRIYAIVVFIIIIGLLFTNISKVIMYLPSVLGFLINESDSILFFVKGLTVWIVFCILSLIINKYTVYYKSYFKFSKLIIIGICIAGIFITTISIMYVSPTKTYTNETTTIYENETTTTYDMGVEESEQIILDASEIPKGTKINIVSNLNNQEDSSSDNTLSRLYLGDTTVLDNFNGNKVIINYRLPTYEINNYDLIACVNPKLTAEFDGNTLNIHYTYDKDIKVVFVPAWPFMWQFDEYQNKNIFNKYLGSSFANGTGYVFIDIE